MVNLRKRFIANLETTCKLLLGQQSPPMLHREVEVESTFSEQASSILKL